MPEQDEREQQRLLYIQTSIGRIEQYTVGGQSDFFRESMVQDAVLRRLETLADATTKLSAALKARYPETPWREIYGFRNVAAHAYEGLDLHRVWEIIVDFLPALKQIIDKELLDGYSGPEEPGPL